MSTTTYQAIFNQLPDVGEALNPILEKHAHLDPMALAELARAILDAYTAGDRAGYRRAREVALESFKARIEA